jgi:hypothetical protein
MTTAITEAQVLDIHVEALQAAKKAESDFISKHGEPWYCGFAWVDVYGVRSNSKLGKALQAVGFDRSSYSKSLKLWNPGGSGTQSMDVKETGARAYADVLRKYGIQAYMGSRAD